MLVSDVEVEPVSVADPVEEVSDPVVVVVPVEAPVYPDGVVVVSVALAEVESDVVVADVSLPEVVVVTDPPVVVAR